MINPPNPFSDPAVTLELGRRFARQAPASPAATSLHSRRPHAFLYVAATAGAIAFVLAWSLALVLFVTS